MCVGVDAYTFGTVSPESWVHVDWVLPFTSWASTVIYASPDCCEVSKFKACVYCATCCTCEATQSLACIRWAVNVCRLNVHTCFLRWSVSSQVHRSHHCVLPTSCRNGWASGNAVKKQNWKPAAKGMGRARETKNWLSLFLEMFLRMNFYETVYVTAKEKEAIQT